MIDWTGRKVDLVGQLRGHPGLMSYFVAHSTAGWHHIVADASRSQDWTRTRRTCTATIVARRVPDAAEANYLNPLKAKSSIILHAFAASSSNQDCHQCIVDEVKFVRKCEPGQIEGETQFYADVKPEFSTIDPTLLLLLLLPLFSIGIAI